MEERIKGLAHATRLWWSAGYLSVVVIQRNLITIQNTDFKI